MSHMGSLGLMTSERLAFCQCVCVCVCVCFAHASHTTPCFLSQCHNCGAHTTVFVFRSDPQVNNPANSSWPRNGSRGCSRIGRGPGSRSSGGFHFFFSNTHFPHITHPVLAICRQKSCFVCVLVRKQNRQHPLFPYVATPFLPYVKKKEFVWLFFSGGRG